MDTTSCARCGQQFTHRADRPRKYCSRTCNYAAKRDTRVCPTCGTEFTCKASAAKTYCSTACSPGRPADPENEVERVCPGCGVTYRTKLWRLAVYCSAQCRSESTKESNVCAVCGTKFTFHKSWPKAYCSQECYGASRFKGGKVDYGPNWAKQRAKAIGRDGACVDCGRGDMLHVHHLVAARKFDGDWQSANHMDNLVTVCKDCHLARHGGVY